MTAFSGRKDGLVQGRSGISEFDAKVMGKSHHCPIRVKNRVAKPIGEAWWMGRISPARPVG